MLELVAKQPKHSLMIAVLSFKLSKPNHCCFSFHHLCREGVAFGPTFSSSSIHAVSLLLGRSLFLRSLARDSRGKLSAQKNKDLSVHV